MVTCWYERLAPSHPRSRPEYSRYRMSKDPKEATRKLLSASTIYRESPPPTVRGNVTFPQSSDLADLEVGLT